MVIEILVQQEIVSWYVVQEIVGDACEHRAQLFLQLRLHGFQDFMSILFQEQICGFGCKCLNGKNFKLQ